MKFVKERREEAGSDDFLFIQKSRKPWNGPHVSGEIARLFSQLGFRFFRFHHLRHCGANLFLLRVIHCLHPEKIPQDAEVFQHEMFQDEKREQLKFLLYGYKPKGLGRAEVQYALHALGRILGHVGPGVFLKDYCHIGSVLFRMFARDYDNKKLTLTARRVMDFLQVDFNRARAILEDVKGKEISASQLYLYQLQELGRPKE
jgi:hypothetical protein